jgi:GT2 family glycosyltransferase
VNDRPLFAVTIATRGRPEHLAHTLDALDAQTDTDFTVTVIDQSDTVDEALDARAAANGRLTVVHDEGRGLSRSRNIGWRGIDAEWIAFVDDDCTADPDWAASLRRVLGRDPPVEFVSGPIGGREPPGDEYVAVTTLEIDEERTLAGRWTRPWIVGFGVCMVVRRSALERLGGFDERLGTGSAEFPASEDMDFNYRLTRSGGAALHTPEPHVQHEQWRRREDLPALYYGYSKGWAGFAIKHLRTGDIKGGLLMWGARAKGILKSFGRGIRMRSGLRIRIAFSEARGLAAGTLIALRRSWDETAATSGRTRAPSSAG